jgi:hypothetical protein
MTGLQAGHEVTRLKIQSATAEKLCFNEAELSQVGARTLDLNILPALQNMEAGYADFVNGWRRPNSPRCGASMILLSLRPAAL